MNKKEASAVISFIKGLPHFDANSGPDYRKMTDRQYDIFEEMVKEMIDNEGADRD